MHKILELQAVQTPGQPSLTSVDKIVIPYTTKR